MDVWGMHGSFVRVRGARNDVSKPEQARTISCAAALHGFIY